MTATDDRVTVLSLLAGCSERTGWLIVFEDGTRRHADTAEGAAEALGAAGASLARVVRLDRVRAS